MKISKKSLLELDFMEDLMDQSQNQTQQIFQDLNVQDPPQEVQLKLAHSHGGIYMRTILEKMETVSTAGMPTITLNLLQICYIIQILMKLLVINHQIVLDR